VFVGKAQASATVTGNLREHCEDALRPAFSTPPAKNHSRYVCVVLAIVFGFHRSLSRWAITSAHLFLSTPNNIHHTTTQCKCNSLQRNELGLRYAVSLKVDLAPGGRRIWVTEDGGQGRKEAERRNGRADRKRASGKNGQADPNGRRAPAGRLPPCRGALWRRINGAWRSPSRKDSSEKIPAGASSDRP